MHLKTFSYGYVITWKRKYPVVYLTTFFLVFLELRNTRTQVVFGEQKKNTFYIFRYWVYHYYQDLQNEHLVQLFYLRNFNTGCWSRQCWHTSKCMIAWMALEALSPISFTPRLTISDTCSETSSPTKISLKIVCASNAKKEFHIWFVPNPWHMTPRQRTARR